IIQKKEITRQDLNTAWTIDIVIKSVFWVFLVLFSYFIASFFEQPELENALYVGSLVLIVNALKNPGTYLLKHDFVYRNIFWLSVIQKLVSFVVVVSIAYLFRSFWALIIANVVASIVFTVGSYFIHAHRPSITFLNIRQQWRFSKWLFFKGIIGYSRSQIDTLIVSKYFSPAQLGQYYMARDIAMLPGTNLVAPAIEPLLAAYKRGREKLEMIEFQVRISLLLVAFISIPITTFIWFFPDAITITLLGKQWVAASEILGVLSLLFFYSSFVLVLQQCLIALQKVRALFFYDLVSFLLIGLLLLALVSESLVEFGLLRGLLGILTMLGLLIYTAFLINLKIVRLLGAMVPIVGSTTVALSLTLMLPNLNTQFEGMLFDLLAKLLVYCLTYMALVAVLIWSATKCSQEYRAIKLFITDLFSGSKDRGV
ncbi:MAG: oligosaccharide flippase family protein, partial [Gammaproteobacteria bacterium]|nr:oligosaccharide flippase family protein [Gammaproteobacteria bacterium]